LLSLFPNIGLEKEKLRKLSILHIFRSIFFVNHQIGLLRNPGHRRAFFEKYAKENGFDPLQAANWYLQPTEKIMATKVINCKFNVIFMCLS
jgi:hypothetical protein